MFFYKRINNIVTILFCITIFITSFSQALAQQNLNHAFQGVDSPLNRGASEAGYQSVINPGDATEELIGNIVRMILSFLGVIFLVLIIYGGYMWMLARGNEQQVEKAKRVIAAAVIGAIIVVAAYAISGFIMQKVGEATLDSGYTSAAGEVY